MATIQFFGNVNLAYEFAAGGSGIGFYGTNAFGDAVSVGAYQRRTFVTNSNGTAQGPQCNNIFWTHANSGTLGQAGGSTNLTSIPNDQSTLKIRFTHDTAVRTQNAKLYIYDRNFSSDFEQHPATGVTTQVCEIRHVDPVIGAGGSGYTAWATFLATTTGTIAPLSASPGSGGLSPSGSSTQSTLHDWFIALSATPNSIGSKTQYGLAVSTEYV